MTEGSGSKKRSSRGLAREVSTSDSRHRAWWAARLCLGLAVVASVLWQGAVDPSALWVVWGLAVLGWVASVPHIPVRQTHGTAALLWMGLGIYTACLLIPLPRAFVHAVHPAAVQISDASRATLGLPNLSSLPIALAPGDTALQVALYLLGGAIAILYGHSLMLPNARARAIRDGDWLGYLGASAGILWMLAYGPVVSTALPATLRMALQQWALINPNHAAGLCAVSVAYAMARMLRSEDIPLRNAYLGLAMLLTGVAIGTGSRGGVMAVVFVIAASLTTVKFKWLHTRTSSDEVAYRKRVNFMLKVLTGTIVGGVLAIPFIEAELLPSISRGTNDVKLRLFSQAAAQVDGGWLLGQGTGALPVALGMVSATTTRRADFAENIVLERFIDQGIWGAVPFFAVLTWLLLRTAMYMKRGSPGIAPWLVCAALLLQNFVDFSLEIAGGLIPFLIAASQAERLRNSTPHHNRRREHASKRARLLVLSTSFAALAVAGVALAQASDDATRMGRSQLRSLDLEAAKTRVSESFGHDHHAFFVLCRKAADAKDYRAAVNLCSRALDLWPTAESARLIRLAAGIDAKDDRFLTADLTQMLQASRSGREQALIICGKHPRAEKALGEALVAVPAMSYKVGRFLVHRRPDLVEKLALKLRQALPAKTHGIDVLLGDMYVQRGHLRRADRIATALIGDRRLAPHGWALQGHIYQRQGKHTLAMPLLDLACRSLGTHGHPSCTDAMRAAVNGLEPRDALRYLRKHQINVRGNPSAEYSYWLLLGSVFLKIEAYEDAIAAAQRAQGLKKDAPRAIALTATAQLALGDWRAAIRLIERLPNTKAWEKTRVELANEVSRTRRSGRL